MTALVGLSELGPNGWKFAEAFVATKHPDFPAIYKEHAE